jgi:hypothetical protein
MNENPWRVDDIARLERERIQEEMRQIRLVEAANRARPPRLDFAARALVRVLLAAKGWFRHAKKPAPAVRPQPQVRLHARHHSKP